VSFDVLGKIKIRLYAQREGQIAPRGLIAEALPPTGRYSSAALYDRWRAETLVHIRGQPIAPRFILEP
jgi:hypothetical protein